MENIETSRISEEQVTEFFALFKSVAQSDFAGWTNESKEEWFAESYSLDFWKNLLKEKKLPIFVTKYKEKMVGFVLLEQITFGVAYLGWIGVLKEYQGKGIGHLLMEKIERYCIENGLHKIELETQEPHLQKFYESHGYKLEGVRKNSWQHLDNYMYGKELS